MFTVGDAPTFARLVGIVTLGQLIAVLLVAVHAELNVIVPQLGLVIVTLTAFPAGPNPAPAMVTGTVVPAVRDEGAPVIVTGSTRVRLVVAGTIGLPTLAIMETGAVLELGKSVGEEA